MHSNSRCGSKTPPPTTQRRRLQSQDETTLRHTATKLSYDNTTTRHSATTITTTPTAHTTALLRLQLTLPTPHYSPLHDISPRLRPQFIHTTLRLSATTAYTTTHTLRTTTPQLIDIINIPITNYQFKFQTRRPTPKSNDLTRQ